MVSGANSKAITREHAVAASERCMHHCNSSHIVLCRFTVYFGNEVLQKIEALNLMSRSHSKS